jgi:heterodisulfide reductase subunit B
MIAQLCSSIAGLREINFYPGCSLVSSGKEMAESYFEVLSLLQVEIRTLADWSCCGSTPAHSIDSRASFLLPARNLLLAEDQGMEALFTLCPSCYVRLWDARRKVLEKEELNQSVKEAWGAHLSGKTKPVFFLGPLISLAAEKRTIFKEGALRGLKVALYYGCLLSRQIWITGLDGHSPRSELERLLGFLGAEPLRWGMEEQCCGAGLGVVKPGHSQMLVARIHNYARRSGANCLVVFCPLCHMNLELRAPKTAPVPVLYVTELLALAARIPKANEWLSKHLVEARGVLKALEAS